MDIPVKGCTVEMLLFKLHLTGMCVYYQHSWSTMLLLLVYTCMYSEDIYVVLDQKLCRQVGRSVSY